MEIWIKADPEREEQVNFLYKIWEESVNVPYQLNTDKAWKTLEGKIDQFETKSGRVHHAITKNKEKKRITTLRKFDKPGRNPGRIGRRIAMVAVSVLVMLSAGIFTHQYYLDLQEAEMAEELVFEELTTQDGERAIYTLSDGSRVILHAGSRLEVPANFNRENRDLFLEGEAYFEVEHDPAKPFVVNSEEVYTRVLGTKFLVQAWPEASRNVEVIVVEGKVTVGDKRSESALAQQEVIITRNQKGVLAAGSSPVVNEVTDFHWHLGWTEGRLVFEDRKLSEILPRLERWYSVAIGTENEAIAEKKLTGEIDYSQPMMEVLTGIALSLDLVVEKKDRTVTFHLAGVEDKKLNKIMGRYGSG